MKKARTALSLAVLACLGICSAAADQITIGPSNENVTFTPAPNAGVNVDLGVCAATCTLTGPAILPGDPFVESYTLTVMPGGPIFFGPNFGSANYPAAVPNNVKTSGKFVGVVNVQNITFNYQMLYALSPNVQFTGSIGTGGYFDFSLKKLTCTNLLAGQPCTITSIEEDYNDGAGVAMAFAPISSGEFVTPEPGSALLLGGGLGILAWWRRRFQRRR